MTENRALQHDPGELGSVGRREGDASARRFSAQLDDRRPAGALEAGTQPGIRRLNIWTRPASGGRAQWRSSHRVPYPMLQAMERPVGRSRAHVDVPALDRVMPVCVAALGFVFVIFVAGAGGGFRPLTWAWTALLSWWIAVIALVVKQRLSFGPLERTIAGGIIAFGGWFALSALWSQSVPSTLDTTIRYLAYAGLVVSALLVVKRRTATHFIGGVTAGIGVLALYGLGTRLLPDRLGEFSSTATNYRLATPIGYWNGMGVFCSMGILLALGFATRAKRVPARATAGAALPMLACAMYFTYSRGAWLALLIGFAAAFAVDPYRLQLALGTVALGAVSGVSLVVVSRSHGVTASGVTLARATHDGHALVVPLLAFAAISAAIAAGLALAESRFKVPGSIRRAWACSLAIAFVIGLGTCWALIGSPSHVGHRAWSEARSSPARGSATNGRLLDLSSNGRLDFWQAALDTFREHPVIGAGGGTYWQAWAARPRAVSATSEEAHSLYLGTLAELGMVGLALLLVALAPPLVAAVRSRRSPIVPLTLGAYVCWLVHSGVDWDWTLVGVSGIGLLCGVGLIAKARVRNTDPPPTVRWGMAVAAAALGLLALTSVMANERLAAARAALVAGQDDRAADDAHSARRSAPWSVAALDLEAVALAHKGQSSEALDLYRRIAARDPNSWLAWTQLAAAASGAERQRAEAIALRLNPLAPRV